MGYAHDYATAIMHRGRVPMEPVDFVPDWADGPRKGKYYPGVDSVPLPESGYPSRASLDAGLAGLAGPAGHGGPVGTTRFARPGEPTRARERDGGFDLAALSGMLLDSYGLTGRRLGVQANSDLSALPFHPLANWSRGTASGGGLYPVSIYWVSGPSGPVTPGVHYYSTHHHAMQRLLTGDVTGEVRAALDGGPGAVPGTAPGPPETDQYLVLGVKHWQNAFKYNSFSFHVVSMDIGACVQTWRMWARARGLSVEPALWFDEERLARLLGVRGEEEGLFAVVPLHWQGAADTPGAADTHGAAETPGPGDAGRPTSPGSVASHAAVRHRDVERSRTVHTFDTVLAMQAATRSHAARRPAPSALAPAAAPPPDRTRELHRLPAPEPMTMDVRTALRRRRSSFGRFDPARPLSAAQLAACLSAAASGARLGGDTGSGRSGDGPSTAKLYAFVNHVEELAPGVYEYDPYGANGTAAPGLRLITSGAPGAFLQRNYFLSNYNLEHAGAVLVPTIRTAAVLDAVGDTGFRLVNATIGAIAQTLYTAASALDVGCGVALGFDNISYVEELGIEDTGESPLLIMMVGNERPHPADFRYEIALNGPVAD